MYYESLIYTSLTLSINNKIKGCQFLFGTMIVIDSQNYQYYCQIEFDHHYIFKNNS